MMQKKVLETLAMQAMKLQAPSRLPPPLPPALPALPPSLPPALPAPPPQNPVILIAMAFVYLLSLMFGYFFL